MARGAQIKPVDPREFAPDQAVYTNARGVQYRRNPGRRKKIDAATGATIFDLQVQIRAAEKTIERLLDEAGIGNSPGARQRVLMQLRRNRGRIDVLWYYQTKKRAVG